MTYVFPGRPSFRKSFNTNNLRHFITATYTHTLRPTYVRLHRVRR